MSRYQEIYQEIYKRIENSPETKRNTYVRRTTGLFTVISIAVLLPVAFFIEKFFGVSGYITCSIAGVLATTFSVLMAEKLANKKFAISQQMKKDI